MMRRLQRLPASVSVRRSPWTPTATVLACRGGLRPLLRRAACQNFATETTSSEQSTLALPCVSRYNQIQVQQLSDHMHKQVFSCDPAPVPKELVELSKDHLRRHDLLGKNTDTSEPIAFEVPKLQGTTLEEHFQRLGQESSEPYRTDALKFANLSIPERPKKWDIERSGWTKYSQGPDGEAISEAVAFPDETQLVFDVEVLYKISPFAVLACAASPTAWYSWISPWVLAAKEAPASDENPVSDRQLIPVGPPSKTRIIVGHNVGYDRGRIAEEYGIMPTKTFFIDTMSLHVAVNGMCSRQRPTWMKHRKNTELREKFEHSDSATGRIIENMPEDIEQELWVGKSSINSLRDVAKFHCNIAIDKTMRDTMGEMSVLQLKEQLTACLEYCAADVAITHKVYRTVLPGFLRVCPHPVSFGALRHLSSVSLPVNNSWDEYIKKAEGTYIGLLDGIQERMLELCQEAVEMRHKKEEYENDPWLQQLDWSGQEIRYLKPKKGETKPRPAAKQKLPGMPMWYKDLHTTSTAPINLSVRTRIAPILLRLSWDGYPLVWTDKYGWTFKVPKSDAAAYEKSPLIQCTELIEEKNPHVAMDTDNIYYKLPHNSGPGTKCATPLAKSFQRYFEDETITSPKPLAKEAIAMNASCSYWISARERIKSQMVVWESDTNMGLEKREGHQQGIILPQLVPMGTITRRAVEKTWLTASNAKKNRVGSELKAMIQAPPGYVFVGADVDSEELWIASLVGDAQFKLHGGNAIGFMTLEGTKAAGTDMHSRTASVLGISRNSAKIFNYGRIYGAGLKFASSLLRQFNPSQTEAEADEIASKLYKVTKGHKVSRKALSPRSFWHGGTESFVFNKLEEFAEQPAPRTPVLGAGITEALLAAYVSKGGFMTSRINWAIQSSGVDYLHLLVISMDYLIRLYNINARLTITVHDEIRYLVKEEDKYRAAMALQVSNLWTRAMFAEQMGINDLPQACAFFSAVDIDHVLRKEVDMDCITPSNPDPIPHGESLDINQLLAKGQKAYLDPNAPCPIILPSAPSEGRIPVMQALGTSSNLHFLRAQIASDDQELRGILKEYRVADPSKFKSTYRKVENDGWKAHTDVSSWEKDDIELTEVYRKPNRVLPSFPKPIPKSYIPKKKRLQSIFA